MALALLALQNSTLKDTCPRPFFYARALRSPKAPLALTRAMPKKSRRKKNDWADLVGGPIRNHGNVGRRTFRLLHGTRLLLLRPVADRVPYLLQSSGKAAGLLPYGGLAFVVSQGAQGRLRRGSTGLLTGGTLRLWVKIMYPTWNPGKRKHGLKPAVPWWFNFDPYPRVNKTSNKSKNAAVGTKKPEKYRCFRPVLRDDPLELPEEEALWLWPSPSPWPGRPGLARAAPSAASAPADHSPLPSCRRRRMLPA